MTDDDRLYLWTTNGVIHKNVLSAYLRAIVLLLRGQLVAEIRRDPAAFLVNVDVVNAYKTDNTSNKKAPASLWLLLSLP